MDEYLIFVSKMLMLTLKLLRVLPHGEYLGLVIKLNPQNLVVTDNKRRGLSGPLPLRTQ
jgi:hypothetical protein